MKKILLPLSILAVTFAYSQVGIGTSTPNTSSILELQASDKGLLLPRVALTDVALAAPLAAHVQGMVVYNTAATITGHTGNAEGIWRNDGTQWRRGTGSGAGSGTDLIGQTSGIISNPTAISGTETWLGENAGLNASTDRSTLIGAEAGRDGSHSRSTVIGYQAGFQATNANTNTLVGISTGYNSTDMSDTTALGHFAGGSSQFASESTFLGMQAGSNSAKANQSIFIGKNAGQGDTVDNTLNDGHSILIGDNTNTSGFSNSVAIGFGAYNKAENEFLIGSYESNPALATQYDIVNPKYPETRDDSGVTPPVNFLYTDAAGKILSAPTSALGGGSSLKLYHENPVAGYISPVAGADNTVAIGHNATTGVGTGTSTAVGYGATASGNNSQAFGESTSASGDQAIAIGGHANASATNAIAIGLGVGSSVPDAMVLGHNAAANGREAIVIGKDVTANNELSILVGHNSTTNANNSILVGNNSTIDGFDSAIFGNSNTVTATSSSSFAFGESVTVDGSRSIIFSSGGTVTGDNSVAFGSGSPSITGDSSVVVGSGVINGTTSSSVGNGNTITGDGSVTMGNSNNISVANAYAFGEANTISSIKGSIALGASNTIAGGQRGIALGQGNTVTGNQAIAIGDSNDVTTGAGSHPFTAAFGHDNTVNGQVITAIGNGITASQNNTIILGPDSGTWTSNVGVGTSTPTAKLDVNGDARIRTIPAGAGTDEVVTVDASGNVRKVSMGTVASGGLLSYVEESLVTGAVDFTTWVNGTLLPFTVENLDDHSDFDTSTYTFTAPANGMYKISGTLAFEGIVLSSANQVTITSYMYFTGASAGLTGRYTENFVNNGTNADGFHIPFSRLVHMDAGDTMTMDLHITAGGGTSFTSGTLQGSSTFLTIQQVK
jgi:hypothetical protein